MNHRQADSAGLPTPTTMSAGEDRFIRHPAVDQGRHQNSDKIDVDPDRRATTGLVLLHQSAPIVARQVQIGVTDQAVQPQSP
jgi:hypothetical protein